MMSIGNQKSPLQNTVFQKNGQLVLSQWYQARKASGHVYVLMVLILPTFYDFSVGLWTCDIFCFILLVHGN